LIVILGAATSEIYYAQLVEEESTRTVRMDATPRLPSSQKAGCSSKAVMRIHAALVFVFSALLFLPARHLGLECRVLEDMETGM
jgi:hypothetical protein